MLSQLFRSASIKTKLMLSMAACLLLFLAISATLSVTLTGKGLRERAVEQELPAVVGEIRNDILRQIGRPLSASLGVANNTFLHGWEAQGLPDEGMAAWKAYAAQLEESQQGGHRVLGVRLHRQVPDREGLRPHAGQGQPARRLAAEFLASGKAYELNLDTRRQHQQDDAVH